MCFIYSSASLFSHTPITSLFPVFPFYRTTPFPLLLPFSVLPLCFQSTPTAAPICLLFCVHLLFLSSVNCSVNPLRVGLQFTLPQLHMSILPPLLLLFFFFFTQAGMELPHLQGGRQGESCMSRAGNGPSLHAWDTAVKNRTVFLSPSFFLCTSGA